MGTRTRLATIGWRQGGISPPRDDSPACLYHTLRICAGLVGEQQVSDDVALARRLLIEQLPEKVRHLGLTVWNDDRERSVADVLALVDKARGKLTV